MGGDTSLGAATLKIGGTLALLAVGLRGASQLLSAHTPLTPGWSVSLVSLALVGAVIPGGVLMAPRLADQSSRLGEKALARMEEATPSMRNAG